MRLAFRLKSTDGDVEEADLVVRAGDIALRCAPLPMEAAGPVEGGGCAEFFCGRERITVGSPTTSQ